MYRLYDHGQHSLFIHNRKCVYDEYFFRKKKLKTQKPFTSQKINVVYVLLMTTKYWKNLKNHILKHLKLQVKNS